MTTPTHHRSTSPRGALALSVTLALLTGCSGGTDTGGTSTASASAGGPAAMAQAFAATLSDEQRTALQQEYTFANASNWSNFPDALLSGMGGGAAGGMGGASGMPSGSMPSGGMSSGGMPSGGMPSGMTGMPSDASPGAAGTAGAASGASTSSGGGRVGLQTSSLDDDQWAALETLLAGVTGSGADEGFDEIMQHLAADDHLADEGGGDDYGRGNYFIAFLGTPADSGTWQLQFGGHHLAVSNTYVDGVLAGGTPSFRGIEPIEEVEVDGETVHPEVQEQKAFAALLASLDEDQVKSATSSSTFNDILLGPGEDWVFPTTSQGLRGADLTDAQRELLVAAIDRYVGDLPAADAATVMARYEAELDDTYVLHSGGTDMTADGDYIRIDGPSVWIEFSMQNGVVLPGAHPHVVWRDRTTDYAGLKS